MGIGVLRCEVESGRLQVAPRHPGPRQRRDRLADLAVVLSQCGHRAPRRRAEREYRRQHVRRARGLPCALHRQARAPRATARRHRSRSARAGVGERQPESRSAQQQRPQGHGEDCSAADPGPPPRRGLFLVVHFVLLPCRPNGAAGGETLRGADRFGRPAGRAAGPAADASAQRGGAARRRARSDGKPTMKVCSRQPRAGRPRRRAMRPAARASAA